MYRKHKANTDKEMAIMAAVEFALGKLLWHDRLHAEMRERAANQTSFSPCTEPSDVAGGTQIIPAKSPFSVALVATPNPYLHLRIKHSG